MPLRPILPLINSPYHRLQQFLPDPKEPVRKHIEIDSLRVVDALFGINAQGKVLHHLMSYHCSRTSKFRRCHYEQSTESNTSIYFYGIPPVEDHNPNIQPNNVQQRLLRRLLNRCRGISTSKFVNDHVDILKNDIFPKTATTCVSLRNLIRQQ